MSTGKRLAKRSILGTRVCAPGGDGLFRAGVIQATRSRTDSDENLYCVLFDPSGGQQRMGEYPWRELVGPGFRQVTSLRLALGQDVFVTHNGREVKGRVQRHSQDEVTIQLEATPPDPLNPSEVRKRIEEVRLMESRKSARLQDLETRDYRRTNSIDIQPNSFGRKRRPSGDDDVMDDCMAAMVLMSLSCSPKSPKLPNGELLGSSSSWASSSSWLSSSWLSSSGSSQRESPPTTPASPPPASPPPTPASPSWQSHHQGKRSRSSSPAEDEGIEMAFHMDEENKQDTWVLYRCTWPGCNREYRVCSQIERHVRTKHLGKDEECDDEDHEEEFYYTEVEESSREQQAGTTGGEVIIEGGGVTPGGVNEELEFEGDEKNSFVFMSSPPTLSHLDMARPPHEDPEYQKQLLLQTPASPINIPDFQPIPWQQHSYSTGIMVSPQKFMRLSPSGKVFKSLNGNGSPSKKSSSSSPLGVGGRGESRKCRKVYGMENRDMWCTQCKWKKACTRFNE